MSKICVGDVVRIDQHPDQRVQGSLCLVVGDWPDKYPTPEAMYGMTRSELSLSLFNQGSERHFRYTESCLIKISEIPKRS
jgi:hypothetical protein